MFGTLIRNKLAPNVESVVSILAATISLLLSYLLDLLYWIISLILLMYALLAFKLIVPHVIAYVETSKQAKLEPKKHFHDQSK